MIKPVKTYSTSPAGCNWKYDVQVFSEHNKKFSEVWKEGEDHIFTIETDDKEIIEQVIVIYEQAFKLGEELGRFKLQNEIKKLLEIKERS